MGLLSALTAKTRVWVEGARSPFSREKTLTELMAAKGLNEFGRVGAGQASLSISATARFSATAQEAAPLAQASSAGSHSVKFVTEFSSFDRQGMIRLNVVALDNRVFKGFCAEGEEIQTFSWGKVRGLMKIVDTGAMLSPYEAYDVYHWS